MTWKEYWDKHGNKDKQCKSCELDNFDMIDIVKMFDESLENDRRKKNESDND